MQWRLYYEHGSKFETFGYMAYRISFGTENIINLLFVPYTWKLYLRRRSSVCKATVPPQPEDVHIYTSSFIDVCTGSKYYPPIFDIPGHRVLRSDDTDCPVQCFMLRTKIVLRLGVKSSKHGLQGRRHICKPNYCFETDLIMIDYSRSLVWC